MATVRQITAPPLRSTITFPRRNFAGDVNAICAPHPYISDHLAKFQSFEEYNQKIEIRELADFWVIYERYLGNYLDLGEQWLTFVAKYQAYVNCDALLIERFYDDPSITKVSQCLYDLCMTVDANLRLENTTSIEGGKFAIYRFDGLIKDIYESLQGIFNIWLPNSGYKMDERYGLDIYRKIDRENSHVIMDLCIPIK
jgi:transcriptional regulator, AraC family